MPLEHQEPDRVLKPGASREVREVVRDEHLMRRRILEALEGGPLTVPDIAAAVGRPAHEVVFWVMGMRKYGHVAEIKEPTEEGFYLYEAVKKEAE
jgi:hypothetical protein